MLPNALVIGVQKGGSSWLTECLGAHPDVFMHPHEVYYFNERFDRDLADYEKLFEGRANESIVGEGTPGYLFSPQAPSRIAATLGTDVKLLASLRDPVRRAYSAFWMYTTTGEIPRGTPFIDFFRSPNKYEIRRRGFYHEQIARYLEIFPKENVLILVQEEDLADGPAAARRCYAHLGVDPDIPYERASTRVNANRNLKLGHRELMNLGRAVSRATSAWAPDAMVRAMRKTYRGLFDRLPEKQEYVPLDAETHALLIREYLDDIHALEDALGRDLSRWYGDGKQ